MIKKALIGFLLLVVLLLGFIYYSYTNLNQYIKIAVEKYGSAATAANVSLSKVNLNLKEGEGTLEGLTVGNPKGFATPHAFYLGLVTVKIDPHSLPGSGPIVIQKVVIAQPEITYEMRGPAESNLQTLQKNCQKYAAQLTGQSKSSDDKGVSTKTSDSNSRKIIIRDLLIQNGKISASHALLQGKKLDLLLPTIHLTNLGNQSGASPTEIGTEILSSITNEASTVSVNSLTQQFGSLLGPASGQVTKIKDQVKGLFNP